MRVSVASTDAAGGGTVAIERSRSVRYSSTGSTTQPSPGDGADWALAESVKPIAQTMTVTKQTKARLMSSPVTKFDQHHADIASCASQHVAQNGRSSRSAFGEPVDSRIARRNKRELVNEKQGMTRRSGKRIHLDARPVQEIVEVKTANSRAHDR